jgi:hypothetical protein
VTEDARFTAIVAEDAGRTLAEGNRRFGEVVAREGRVKPDGG